MNNTYTVQESQTLEDVAVQLLGSAEAKFALAEMNNLGYTATLKTGQVLILPDVYDKKVSLYFKENGYIPAVRQDQQDLEGIEYWILELETEVQ